MPSYLIYLYSGLKEIISFFFASKPWGYKTFFVLNSAEQGISIAHRNLNAEK